MDSARSSVHLDRVLVLAPTSVDASLTEDLLVEAGLECFVCNSLTMLCQELHRGAGVLLLTEEVLAEGEPEALTRILRQQPKWSDLPILLLTGSGADSPTAVWALDLLGNVTVFERPVRINTLISGLRAAQRARRRQYELRDQMESLRNQSDRLRMLWEAASVLLSTDQPDAMMRGLFAKIAPLFGLDAYFNFTVDESGRSLRLESCCGIPDDEARKIARLEFGQAICGTVALRGQPITATSIQSSHDPKTELARGYGLKAYTCNPLLVGARLLGTLSFASRTRDSFEDDEIEFLRTVCHYVAYAYERLRLIHKLREEDRKKDEFLATLAHELRNPLAPIRNAAEFLRLKSSSDSDVENAREIIDRQVCQMTRLVDDLLDISRVTRGKVTLQRERISLGLVLANAVELTRPVVEKGAHSLTVELPLEPLYVTGDATRLGQVFGNLLTNAAKYTDRGGAIRVSAERRNGVVAVGVKDNGIGVAAEHLPRLFEMFSQVEPALARSQGGLGIGLALVKSLVEMHGGRVEAFSDGPGAGSLFVVELPLSDQAPEASTAGDLDSRGAQGRGAPRRVLVADDNADSARSLAMMLSLMGHDVRTAPDGLEAVRTAAEFQPDVILLDIGMPRMNGYEAAAQIRKLPWGRSATLAALTGWGQDEDKRRAEEAGFDRHFTKPVEAVAVAELLRDLSRRPR